jgi:hypothetical protein
LGAKTKRALQGMVETDGRAFPHAPPQPGVEVGLDPVPGRAIAKD